MCFQHTDDLPIAPTEHLFNIHLEGLRHKELELGYDVMISLELSKHLTGLHIDDFYDSFEYYISQHQRGEIVRSCHMICLVKHIIRCPPVPAPTLA